MRMAHTEIDTLSLHDALPIYNCDQALLANDGIADCNDPVRFCSRASRGAFFNVSEVSQIGGYLRDFRNVKKRDRKSTRLNSSHGYISYAVFCLKKKTKKQQNI